MTTPTPRTDALLGKKMMAAIQHEGRIYIAEPDVRAAINSALETNKTRNERIATLETDLTAALARAEKAEELAETWRKAASVMGGRALHEAERAEKAEKDAVSIPALLEEETRSLVLRFATALALKLRRAEEKYGFGIGWAKDDWMDECREELREHVAKGDPLDVAAYCAFLWHHGESTKNSAIERGRD